MDPNPHPTRPPSWPMLVVAAVAVFALACSAGAVTSPLAADTVSTDPIRLTVRETAGVPRSDEVIRSGVPLAADREVTSVNDLAIVDEAGIPVAADFRVLARWNAALDDATAPMQWVQVIFAADLDAAASTEFSLVTDGSVPTPAPATAITSGESGGILTIDTGAAEFVLDPSASALFSSVRNAQGSEVITGGDLRAVRNGTSGTRDELREYRIEHASPLSLSVVVSGEYSHPAVAGGAVSEQRRYVFSAGSATAQVRHSVQWEGDRCGNGVTYCAGSPNAVLVTEVRDTLDLAVGANGTVEVQGARDQSTVSGPTSLPGQVTQDLRTDRTQPMASTVSAGGSSFDHGSVDGAILVVTGDGGGVGTSLDHAHRYEPQGLAYADDVLSVLPIADTAWLGARQGTWATVAVTALDPGEGIESVRRSGWAAINHPLRAWPDTETWNASQAVDAIAPLDLPPEFAAYNDAITGTLDHTLESIDEKGLTGIMTFGSFPRLWDSWLYGDEIDCGDDPTPGSANNWDDPYWCATWTDYHNAISLAPTQAMRTGEVELLDEIASPGALRMLYTQLMRCAPEDDYFYCGQAPTGYGGFRANFNSSHAYFDNLILMYWLTGDSTIVTELQAGGDTMRNYLCDRRPAAPCLPTDPQTDEWAFVAGRSGMQWEYTFRFLGLASADATFLEDWQANLAIAATRHYAQVSQDGTTYGIWSDRGIETEPQAGSDQLWMASLYDMRMIHRLMIDTDDAPIGSPAIRPSAILSNWARTLVDFGATLEGDGTAFGNWPNALIFDYSGPRIGGTLTSIGSDTSGSDPYLYDTGKASLSAVLAQAGALTGDTDLSNMATDMVGIAVGASIADDGPLSKIQAELLHRVGPAIAVLAQDSPLPTFSDVPTSHAFFSEIEWVAEQNIVGGYLDGTYRPTRVISRQSALLMLWRMAGSPIVADDPDFDDVSSDHPFHDAIAWGWFTGLASGYADNTFRPTEAVTRQTFVALLWRLEGWPDPGNDPGFLDVPATHLFSPAIWWAANQGITTGDGDGSFGPAKPVSRQSAAAFLARAAS